MDPERRCSWEVRSGAQEQVRLKLAYHVLNNALQQRRERQGSAPPGGTGKGCIESQEHNDWQGSLLMHMESKHEAAERSIRACAGHARHFRLPPQHHQARRHRSHSHQCGRTRADLHAVPVRAAHNGGFTRPTIACTCVGSARPRWRFLGYALAPDAHRRVVCCVLP